MVVAAAPFASTTILDLRERDVAAHGFGGRRCRVWSGIRMAAVNQMCVCVSLPPVGLLLLSSARTLETKKDVYIMYAYL